MRTLAVVLLAGALFGGLYVAGNAIASMKCAVATHSARVS